MKQAIYCATFKTKIECFSKKEADAHNKPLIKGLKAFAAAFGAEIEFRDGTAQAATPGFTVYHLTASFDVQIKPSLVLGVAAACQTFADLYGIEMDKESYHTVPDETDTY